MNTQNQDKTNLLEELVSLIDKLESLRESALAAAERCPRSAPEPNANQRWRLVASSLKDAKKEIAHWTYNLMGLAFADEMRREKGKPNGP
jgi:hypothetical protein